VSTIPESNLQMIIHSAPNLRDAGGYITHSGDRMRTGLLYRSEQLSRITDADLLALEKLGLKKIYDLRTQDERAEQPDRVPAGAQDVVVDVLADEKQAAPAELLHLLSNPQEANARLGGGKAVAMFTKGYIDIVSLPSARAGFAKMFTDLADASNLPALFHCTTGKDRTGWASAALLTLCGVSRDDVMRDYLLSNDYILPEYQSLVDKYTGIGVEKDILLSILGVRSEYLEASFEEMRDKFGGIEDYFAQGLGIDPAGQQALREQFVEHK
jgi:protein-tyrosine phosphatase